MKRWGIGGVNPSSIHPLLSRCFGEGATCSFLNLVLKKLSTEPQASVTHSPGAKTSTMFSSFTSFSNPFSVPRFLQAKPSSAIDITSVEIHDVETKPEKRARTLKHLLKLNHANHAVIYHDLHFHNHMPHVRPSIRAIYNALSS